MMAIPKETAAEIERLWLKGNSAGRIIQILAIPHITRNMILGMVWRHGLRKRKTREGVHGVARKPPQKKPKPITPPPTEPETPGLSLVELTAGQCRFPRGDDPYTMTFCGAPAEGCPYCSFHAKIVYDRARTQASGRKVVR